MDFTIESNRDTLKDKLRKGVVTVKFTKKDGSERVMQCTLSPNVIGESDTTTNNTRKVNADVCAVYDNEANGWRSFRWDSILEIVS